MSAIEVQFPRSARYMILSALGFVLMGVCVKEVSNLGVPLFEIIAVRALVSLLISYLDIKRKGISPWGERKDLLVLRGLSGTFALICVYYAVSTMPLAEATFLQYLHPAFTAIIALFFLKEHVHFSTIACILLSLAGLMLIAQPSFLFASAIELPSISIIAAVLGALGSAIAYVIVRRLSKTEDSSVIIFYFPFVALPVALLLPGQDFIMPNAHQMLLLILLGIFTQIGQIGLTKAMQTETASKATAYSYVQVIFAIILGWLFFDELPTLWAWIGGTLIIIGALINTFWRH